MRIGIDVFSFDKPGQNYGVGPGVYVWHLLPKLFDLGRDHTFVVFANRQNREMIPYGSNVTLAVSPFNNHFRSNRLFHEQIFLPFQFHSRKLDFIHCMGNNVPFLFPCKSVLTVYDLMWKYYLEMGITSWKQRYFQYTVPRSFKSAKALITISRFVADQIARAYTKEPATIFPILLAKGALAAPSVDEENLYRRKYGFPFIYSVTTSMPHKNLMTLLKAFMEIKRRHVFEGKLVVSGQLKGKYHLTSRNFITESKLADDVILSGFVSEPEKTYCYRNAVGFVYPSLYEGFGLPVLEAMECRTPVIASDAASIPEVGGDACLYFNPNSVEDLVDKMARLLTHDRMRTEMIEKGIAQCKRFSWERTAAETLRAYKRTLLFGHG